MKRKFIYTVILVPVFCLCNLEAAQAQFSEASDILRASTTDANLLLKNYFKPIGKGFGASLNSGWVNTAKPYRPFRFDIRVDATVANVPFADEVFDLAEIGLSPNVEIIGNSFTSTAVGNGGGPTLRRTESVTDPSTNESIETEVFRFRMPEGYGIALVPAPMAQITIGFIKNTDISFRFIPTIEVPGVDDLEAGLIGFGFKHGINQWLPAGDKFPFDLSLQFGFTSFNAEIDFEVFPEAGPDDPSIDNPFDSSVWENQKATLKTKAFTGNLLIGKTLPVLTLWIGAGLQSSTFSVKTPGAFPAVVRNESYEQSPQTEKPFIIERIDDPVNFEIKGANTIHAVGGARIRLAILTFSGSYTFSKYDVASLGFGLSLK